MTPANENKRGFLFLQGPHGPFYAELSQHLEDLGHKTWRVAFNQGDVAFWKNKKNSDPLYRATYRVGQLFSRIGEVQKDNRYCSLRGYERNPCNGCFTCKTAEPNRTRL